MGERHSVATGRGAQRSEIDPLHGPPGLRCLVTLRLRGISSRRRQPTEFRGVRGLTAMSRDLPATNH